VRRGGWACATGGERRAGYPTSRQSCRQPRLPARPLAGGELTRNPDAILITQGLRLGAPPRATGGVRGSGRQGRPRSGRERGMGPTHCELAHGPPVEVVPTSWTGTWTGRVGAVDPSALEKDRLRGPLARRSSLPRVPVQQPEILGGGAACHSLHWLRRPTQRSEDPDLPGAESELAGHRCPGGQGFESLSATDDGPGR
jgi:hypothetical protein